LEQSKNKIPGHPQIPGKDPDRRHNGTTELVAFKGLAARLRIRLRHANTRNALGFGAVTARRFPVAPGT